jgi:hypothetical protein
VIYTPTVPNAGLSLHETFDARVWAAEFVKRFGGDEELMIGWFANAIMAGYDIGRRPLETQISRLEADKACAFANLAAYEDAMRANLMSTGAAYLQRHIHECCLAVGRSARRRREDGTWESMGSNLPDAIMSLQRDFWALGGSSPTQSV